MAKYRSVYGVKYRMYDSIEACAARAVSEFQRHNWRWHTGEPLSPLPTGPGFIPDHDQILTALRALHVLAKEISTEDFGESGRLLYYKNQYGHEIAT